MHLESWVFGGNDPELGLGLNHLPYTAFTDEDTGTRRLGVAIGACILDLYAASDTLPPSLRVALREPTLNLLMSMGASSWTELRTALQFLLSTDNRDRHTLEAALIPRRLLTLELPAKTENYTDFYASIDHARRVGKLFRPDQPLLENYAWIPIAYHGRASSICPSDTPVRRPSGQIRGDLQPRFGPTEKLDYEAELAFFIGDGNKLGSPIPIEAAGERIFGVSLLNDWSARDIQAWEYQPLGPFLGKSFATTLSPLLTPLAALEPFRVPATKHEIGLLPYLESARDQQLGSIALTVKVYLATRASQAAQLSPLQLGTTTTSHLYWTPAQMVTHHTSNGCNLLPGDVLASGTISGPESKTAGCLLELTCNGAEPLSLPHGETRRFLEDGDEIILTASSRAPGQMPINLGECRSTVLKAL